MKFTIALVAAVGAVVEAAEFKSGAVTGFEKFTYGKFITRMKAPNKPGTVSSFFTYWNGPDFYPGGWNELDVEIVPSVQGNPLSMNVIYGDGEKKRETHDYKNSWDPKDDWHIYEMAWTPDFIAWSVDNKEVRRVTNSDPSVKLTNKPMSVMMNFWTPTFESWGKGLDAKDMPWYLEYDYVETYTYNHETSGFDFNWRDSFNTFDTNRWHKSDNTTFDANSTVFRGSQAYIKNGSLVLKMEPDTAEGVHGADHWKPVTHETIKTEPTAEHHAEKGKKVKPADEHYDVGAEQHYAYMKREAHEDEEARFARQYATPYGPMHEYGSMPGYPYAPHGQYAESYGEHTDPYATHHSEYYQPEHYGQEYNPYAHHQSVEHQGDEHHPLNFDEHKHEKTTHDYMEDPFHFDPYHHPNPPKTQAEAEKHLGAEAALFYKEMHNKKQQQQPKSQGQKGKKNFVAGFEESDETPYEHDHHGERHETHELMHGVEHHDKAHFEQGYWDLKDHVPHLEDEGHFAGEEHGEYHYIEPERTHHMGHYYSYEDDEEHHGQHSDEHHNTHGIEHRPDDWHHDTRVHHVHHDEYIEEPGYRHHEDHDLIHNDHHVFDQHSEHRGEHYGDHHGVQDLHHDGHHSYTHDAEFHDGSALKHDVEHEYDELYHEIEQDTKHGVEHHDVHFTTEHPIDSHHRTGTDIFTEAAHEYAEPVHHSEEHQERHSEGYHALDHHDDHHAFLN